MVVLTSNEPLMIELLHMRPPVIVNAVYQIRL